MEAYDIVLIYSFFAQEAFARKYGDFFPGTTSYQITTPWQVGISNAVGIGTIIGAFANGYFTQKFGYMKVLLVSLSSMVAFIFIPFFAPNMTALLIGEMLCGIPWRVFATIGPAYAPEVCPLALRGYLTVYVNLCWAFGQLISAGVQSGFSDSNTQWAYKIPFAIQWVWPVPLFTVPYFAPKSQWHLVRASKHEQAEKSIIRLAASS
jgi:SP family general alpha glucoside:H+ symporter-like MFS transporter